MSYRSLSALLLWLSASPAFAVSVTCPGVTTGYVLSCDGTEHGAWVAPLDASGTPLAGRYARWVDVDTIEGVSVATLQSDLGLGAAAYLEIGTTTGTVAAGDDSRFTITLSGDTAGTGAGAITTRTTRVSELVRNESGSSIPSTRAVCVTGFNNYPLIGLCDNTNEDLHNPLGVTESTCANNSNCYICTHGHCAAQTNGWPVGSDLYLSTAGALTVTQPSNGAVVEIGKVTEAEDYPQGSIELQQRTEPHVVAAPSGADVVLRAGDAAGVNKVSIRNYANAEVGYIDSNGALGVPHAGTHSSAGSDPIDPADIGVAPLGISGALADATTGTSFAAPIRVANAPSTSQVIASSGSTWYKMTPFNDTLSAGAGGWLTWDSVNQRAVVNADVCVAVSLTSLWTSTVSGQSYAAVRVNELATGDVLLWGPGPSGVNHRGAGTQVLCPSEGDTVSAWLFTGPAATFTSSPVASDMKLVIQPLAVGSAP